MELYLDQFGSLLSGPDNVGQVVVDLHHEQGAGGRMVSLLDLGSDDEAEASPRLAPPQAEEPASKAVPDVQSSAEAWACLGGAAGVPDASQHHEASEEKEAEVLMGEEARDGEFERFVATMMATLSKEIGLDAPKAILPSGAGTSSRAEASQLEKENFDTEGNL